MNEISVQQHIETDHRAYAIYDNQRMIPHIADGLKTSLRKVVYTAQKTMKGTNQVKVAALGSRASDFTDYDHGEASIIDVVVTLARDYSGTNNVPLLQRHGQFGMVSDNKPSEPRYIYVSKHANMAKVLRDEDNAVLPMLFEKGEQIEPEFYLPVIPLVLCNASDGVGNGYANYILPRDPKNLVKMVKAILEDTPVDPAWSLPHFKGFKGRVLATGPRSYEITGALELNRKAEFTITDLPPEGRFQYESYKDRVLLPLLDKKAIKGFDNDSTEHEWSIKVQATKEFVAQRNLHKVMGLITRTTENLTVWNWAGKLQRYESAEELCRDWVRGRVQWMETRRLDQIQGLQVEYEWLMHRATFLRWWNSNSAEAIKMTNQEIRDALHALAPTITNEVVTRLLSLPVSSLKHASAEELTNTINAVAAKIEFLEGTTPEAMLLKDMEDCKF